MLLGAGASIASTKLDPEKNGKCLPSMNDLPRVIPMQDLLTQIPASLYSDNFETLYSNLYLDNSENPVLGEMNKRVYDYFSSLSLPDKPTIYDYLVMGLRFKDLIVTFNWDPFLYQAWCRNKGHGSKPMIRFLHGNVAIGYDEEDLKCGPAGWYRRDNEHFFKPTPLLYPTGEKNYEQDPFIKREWTRLKEALHNETTWRITIYGYSAPVSDQAAIKLMNEAWGTPDKRNVEQFEMEEVTDADAPTLEGTFGCRYLHSFYDPNTGLFDHFDGAVRCYDLDQICERLNKPINQAGHHAQYTKLFRIDGRVPISKWKSLITHYLRGNEDVYRYFGVSTPFVTKNQEKVSPIAKYVPFVVKPGSGVRILFSYHSLQKQDIERNFTDFDTCYLREGSVETTDLMSVDLTKCIRRSGGMIEYPSCKYISYRDNYHDIPEIYHGGAEPYKALKTTIDGIKMLLTGLKGRGVEDCLSFCLSWNLEDRKAKISVMGAVPDLLDWFKSVADLPVDREGIRKWLSQQAANLKKQGKDTPSPIYGSYIHSNGIFYHHRRLLQRDAELKELFYDNSKGLCGSMEFSEEDAEVKSLYEEGHIYPVPYVVVGDLRCKGNEDYLQCEEISCLGETECDATISFMTLVWASDQNGLTSLIQ